MKSAEKIKSYILAAINFEGENGETFTTEEEKITELMSRFKAEYWYYENQVYYKNNMVKAMVGWLQGLPSEIGIAFYYNEIDSLLIEWGYLKHTSRETTIYRERDNYWLYLASSLISMAKRYNLA